MANECTVYYQRAITALNDAGIRNPAEMFWAGVFAGICEQVMMKVKPAGMVASDMPRATETSSIVAEIYHLHREVINKPGGGFEVWVVRPDNASALADLERLVAGGLDWGEFHALRGRLCGYSEDVIRTYTEGVWP